MSTSAASCKYRSKNIKEYPLSSKHRHDAALWIDGTFLVKDKPIVGTLGLQVEDSRSFLGCFVISCPQYQRTWKDRRNFCHQKLTCRFFIGLFFGNNDSIDMAFRLDWVWRNCSPIGDSSNDNRLLIFTPSTGPNLLKNSLNILSTSGAHLHRIADNYRWTRFE